ncbi:MAG: phage shock protein [Clostridia bacterium]|nr:phage shock protein [Clostridia bacterium]
MLLPLNSIEEKVVELIPDKDTKIFVYCRSGNRSKTASELLIKLGYTNVYDMGGINDWPYETE